VPRSKNAWSYTSTPQYVFMAWCLVKAQGRLYLLTLHFTHWIRRLDEPLSRSGRGGEEKKYLYHCGELNHGHPARSLVTTPTEMYRLPCATTLWRGA